jgi:Putative zinc-finger
MRAYETVTPQRRSVIAITPNDALRRSNVRTCVQIVERVTEFLEGALPADEHARVNNHLRGCADCLRYEFRRLFDAMLLDHKHRIHSLLAWSRWRRRSQPAPPTATSAHGNSNPPNDHELRLSYLAAELLAAAGRIPEATGLTQIASAALETGPSAILPGWRPPNADKHAHGRTPFWRLPVSTGRRDFWRHDVPSVVTPQGSQHPPPLRRNWLLIVQCVLEAALFVDDRDLIAEAAALLADCDERAVFNAGAVMFHGSPTRPSPEPPSFVATPVRWSGCGTTLSRRTNVSGAMVVGARGGMDQRRRAERTVG